MTQSQPAKALSGSKTGHICDRCNKGLKTGDLARAYATHYPRDGWVLRRVWCEECGGTTIDSATEDADEALIEAVFWNYRLMSVEVRDRSRPYVGSEQ